MFTFVPLQLRHLGLLRHWLAQEHVKKFWQETEDEQKFREKFLVELPARSVRAFVIVHDSREIGFAQYYEADKVGGGWWPGEPPGTFGVDLFLGERELLGKGMGPAAIGAFVSFMGKQEPAMRSLLIDPSPVNRRAIRAFEKAGFVADGEISTPGGVALLMRMRGLGRG
ncbi:MAG: GNAT family N-acetyltransferase [Bdellovibrionota bacterium]